MTRRRKVTIICLKRGFGMFRRITHPSNGARVLAVIVTVGSLVLSSSALQAKKPISKKGLLEAIRLNGLSTSELIERIQERGVNFQMTDDDVRDLQQAGARPELIEAVKANYRPGASSGSSRPDTPRINGTDFNVPAGSPLSQNEVVTLLHSGVASARVEKILEARGVDLTLTPQI